jgi:hypothetical protein
LGEGKLFSRPEQKPVKGDKMKKTKSIRPRNPRRIGPKPLNKDVLDFNSRQLKLNLEIESRETPLAAPSKNMPQKREEGTIAGDSESI